MTILKTVRAAALAGGASLAMSCAPSGAAPAFPGAVGYGAGADGWRGGQIVPVTNLNNSGAGSLRNCAETMTGPRVCVFKVSGTIVLSSNIRVRSDVYIAGQTAPGYGIQLRLDGTSNNGPLVIKNADDVVIRFLKSRPGTGPNPQSIDAVTVENSQRVYLGNLSLGFATDEIFNIHVSSSSVQDITIADSILAYGLDKAGHPEGNHSKGALICSFDGASSCGRVSIIRNLFAHNRDRNPDVKGTAIGPVEILGNVFYNPISQFGEVYNYFGHLDVAYFGNVAIKGPSSGSGASAALDAFVADNGKSLTIDAGRNLALGGSGCPKETPFPVLGPTAKAHYVAGSVPVTYQPAAPANAVSLVTERAGDKLPNGKHRDALDNRVINDINNCTGKVISSPSEVGGWPAIPANGPAVDTDGDHLPDWFETQHGLDPAQPTDPWTLVNGTAAIEVLLAAMAGDA